MKEATTSYKSLNTFLPYFGIKAEDYWHIDYQILESQENFDYFWDLSAKYTGYSGEYDECDIPLYLGADGLKHYSVIFLGHYAIGAYQDFLKSSNPKSLEALKKVSNWLVENLESNRDCENVWVNRYPMATFNLHDDWVSCLCQAKGISTLVRAYYAFGDQKYLDASFSAAKAYLVDKEDGGVKVEKNGLLFWEEYPTEGGDSVVLNGHIFAIWSIYDLLSIKTKCDIYAHEQDKLKALFERAINDLKVGLSMWDTGYWTKYDIFDSHYNIASHFYHDLHIKQLKILYLITGDEFFLDFSNKWAMYESSFFNRMKALYEKVIFRLK
jgi:heparosan-N-sulfate-glucuronate 5-epimerase